MSCRIHIIQNLPGYNIIDVFAIVRALDSGWQGTCFSNQGSYFGSLVLKGGLLLFGHSCTEDAHVGAGLA